MLPIILGVPFASHGALAPSKVMYKSALRVNPPRKDRLEEANFTLCSVQSLKKLP
ncbi:hypothetical protein CSKR_201324 [Clonorchis sinensis]|uniref:Uncharacterized protein n=1 Tax=Clonorchis sinensis TaxID=79923 RepID=A0A8T1MQ28_CLOSI|nr:hypothetical protein CSKR_201324 [Clonorchis sinensis]